MAAALFAALAVLASLFVGPAATVAQAAAPAAIASTVRGMGPLAIGTRDHLRAAPRRGVREQSQRAVALERPATTGQGPAPLAALLGSPGLVAPLVTGFLTDRDRTGQVSRRMPGTRRDRAPPAFALV